MSPRSRLLVAAAALLLLVLYVTPLWRIDLGAPQYPEGLGLRIWIDRIEGAGEHDLANINMLNHYIGMARIEPDQIPELVLMPKLIAGLIVLGLAAAALGRRGVLVAYTGLYALIALAGLADFWKWEYEYGHNLDPTAAIKVPGMVYQPPLIGSKMLLNFEASSWPDVGGVAAVLSLAVIAAVTLRELWRWRRRPRPGVAGTLEPTRALAVAAAVAVLLACGTPAPRAIAYNAESCAHCHMTIADPRLAAQLVHRTGKTLAFDDPGCLAAYLASGRIARTAIHSLWLGDYAVEKEHWLAAETAHLVQSGEIRTPMAYGAAALGRADAADSLQRILGGRVLRWAEFAAAAAAAAAARS